MALVSCVFINHHTFFDRVYHYIFDTEIMYFKATHTELHNTINLV